MYLEFLNCFSVNTLLEVDYFFKYLLYRVVLQSRKQRFTRFIHKIWRAVYAIVILHVDY